MAKEKTSVNARGVGILSSGQTCDPNVMYVVTTTGGASCNYGRFSKKENGANEKQASCLVCGGANVANKKSGEAVDKVETVLPGSTINDLLLSNPAFKRKMDRGYIVISRRGVKASTLEAKDASAQKVKEDFVAAGAATPKEDKE